MTPHEAHLRTINAACESIFNNGNYPAGVSHETVSSPDPAPIECCQCGGPVTDFSDRYSWDWPRDQTKCLPCEYMDLQEQLSCVRSQRAAARAHCEQLRGELDLLRAALAKARPS